MQIGTDLFERNVLILFKGEYQIRLAYLIANKLHRKKSKSLADLWNENEGMDDLSNDNKTRDFIKKHFHDKDTVPYMIYYPKKHKYHCSDYTVFIYNSLERSRALNQSIDPKLKNSPSLGYISSDLGSHWEGLKLMSSKEFFYQYGKELFNSEQDRNNFLEETTHMQDIGILKFIRNIKY